MTGVIYADVLFILNTYITYAILVLTAYFLHLSPKRLRILFASIIGGAGSLIIIFPWVNDIILAFLHKKNLGNLTPHKLYSAFHYSHPTLAERMGALDSEGQK